MRRSFGASWVATVIAPAIVGEPARAGDADAAWERLEPGVEHAHARIHDESELVAPGAVFELYRFDLARFRPEVIISTARPFARRRAADVLRRFGASSTLSPTCRSTSTCSKRCSQKSLTPSRSGSS